MKIKYIIKASVSAAILYVLFNSIDLDRIFIMLSNAEMEMLVFAFCLVLLIRLIMAYRWQIVLKLYGISTRFLNILSIVFISNSIGHLLPGGIGVDVVRAYQFSAQDGNEENIGEVVSSIVIDRMAGVVTLLVISFMASILGNIFNDISIVFSVISGSLLLVLAGMYLIIQRLAAYDYIRSSRGLKAYVFNVIARMSRLFRSARFSRLSIFKLMLPTYQI